MIRRETDTALLDVIGAQVRENICYHEDAIDWRPVVDGCVVLSNGVDAAAIFEMTAPGIYQVHVMFGPTCRGKTAVQAGIAMRDHMFREQGASMLWGATPLNNPAARWFNRQLGARPVMTDTYEAEGPVELFKIEQAA